MTDDLLERLRETVGGEHVLADEADMAAYVVDWTGAYQGRALAVVRPGSTAEVAAVVAACHAAGVALVPQGGNTGLVAGGVPDDSGTQVVLSLGRMRRIRGVDPVANTITVEAGVVLADVQAAAAEAGRLFPMSLGSEGSCTIGGNLATNAGGTAVLRYGMTRELALGLEVVLPDGRVWDGLRGLRKDNTGYSLKDVYIGSEGTLGVITAAVLRLFPPTPARATAWVSVADVASAVTLLGLVQAHAGAHLATFEIVNRAALDLVLTHLPGSHDPAPGATADWSVLVELAGTSDLDAPLEAALTEAVERGLVEDAAVAGSPAQRSALWALREGISEAQKVEGATLKHDVTLPIADLAAWTDRIAPTLEAILPGVRRVTYGHVGDGNLHFNLSAPVVGGSGYNDDDALRAAAVDLSTAIYDSVADSAGSISAEHGLGSTKAAAAASYKSEVEVDLMRAIKNALDPQGLMNPGTLLP